MNKFEMIKWLQNLKDDIGQTQHQDLWHYEKMLDEVIVALENSEDCVSKQYLLAEIEDLADEFSEVDENGLHSERWCGIMDSKGVIKNAPCVTTEQSLVDGEWIAKDGVFYCSCCDNDSGLSEEDVNLYEIPLPNYCKDCGAKMK